MMQAMCGISDSALRTFLEPWRARPGTGLSPLPGLCVSYCLTQRRKARKSAMELFVFGSGYAALGVFGSGVQTLIHRRKVGGDLLQSAKQSQILQFVF
jgi:hypothetical protein